MKLKLIIVSALAAGLASAATIQMGNIPQPGELNVLLNQGPSGLQVTGLVGGVLDLFDSTQILINPSSGQARTEALVGLLNNVKLSLGGITFGDVIFDLHCNQGSGGCPTAHNTIMIATSDGTTASFLAGPGQNFFTITGTGLTSVSIKMSDGASDIRQVRFSNIAGVVTTPEPAAIGLMLVGLGAVRLRRGRFPKGA